MSNDMSGFSAEDLNTNKRTQDELNYDGASDETIGKRVKLDESVTASKTIHARNLPPDCTEHDLMTIAAPFGPIVNILLLKGKNQALIQMRDLESTASLLQYYNSVRANIRGKTIYFQYSNRDEITALQSSQKQEKKNHILLVSVLNLLYPIDINVLHHVFSKYGTILKIVIFNKQAGFQALIQFLDVNSAVEAKMELDGQNIYSGCCTLRIQFSSLTNLNVKYNNEKSRDFTNPNLPTTSSADPNFGLGPLLDDYNYPPGIGMPKNMPTAVLIVSGLNKDSVTPDVLFTLFGVYGDVTRVKILHNKRDTALVQFSNPQQAETALAHLNLCPLHNSTLRVNFSKHSSISLPRAGTAEATGEAANLTKDFTNSPLHRYKVLGSRNFNHICPPSAVLHLSNLPENSTEEWVKGLFTPYGTVTGFRFFPKDKRMALVQMGSLSQAVEALVNVHNTPVEGGSIRVSFSKSSL